MTQTIQIAAFRNEFLTVWEEVFEKVHGYLLDKETSMFETLATVTAEEASRPISAQSASLAAQVNHVRFYIDAINERLQNGPDHRVDWASSWNVPPVSDKEWQELIARLRVAYQGVCDFAQTFEGWDEDFIGGAFALLGHSAYHLGEIRQGLGVLRS